MDKKTLPLVIGLLVCIVFYWQILEFFGIVEPTPADSGSTTRDSISVVDSSTPTRPAPDPASIATTPTGSVQQATPEVAAITDSLPVDTVIIETGKYTVLLSSVGGGPVSMLLKDYTYRDGRPIQMMPEAASATPTTVFADGSFSTEFLPFTCSKSAGTYSITSSYQEVEYRYSRPEGGEIVRTYTFYPDDYHFDLRVQVLDVAQFPFERSYSLEWNTPLGVTEPDPKNDFASMGAVAMQGGARIDLDDFEDGRMDQTEEGTASWAGQRSLYFAAVMMPQEKYADAVSAKGSVYQAQTEKGAVEGKKINVGMRMHIDAGRDIDDRFRIFVGPLDYSLMSDYDVELEAILGIGTTPVIGWLIKPFAIFIMWLLPIMFSVIPNYGFVIIIFAFLVKVVTLPLSLKSFKSMNAMKELQPRIEKLKEKHKKDAQALNSEMMKMYKKHGVNPMSGCLPILPQMPLLFALFSVFRSTILLRDAPFIWFITDLSRGASGLLDPYIILVLLMVAAQFVSQKLTMASTQQNKALIYIMPLFMGFIFYSYSAGLVLYWTCFSLLSMLDYAVFRRNKNPEVKAT